jgi:hypothetical protein
VLRIREILGRIRIRIHESVSGFRFSSTVGTKTVRFYLNSMKASLEKFIFLRLINLKTLFSTFSFLVIFLSIKDQDPELDPDLLKKITDPDPGGPKILRYITYRYFNVKARQKLNKR